MTALIRSFALALLAAALVAGCGLLPDAGKDETAGWSADRIYKSAHDSMLEGNYTRAVKMFEQVNVPVLGVIENMSYFIAPDTGNKYEIFGRGGGQKLCDEYGLNFLGEVPMGMEVREGGDKGIPVVVSFPESPQSLAFDHVAEEVARQISIEAMKPELVIMSRA